MVFQNKVLAIIYIIRALAAKFKILLLIMTLNLITSWSSPISIEVNVGYSLATIRR